MSRPDFYLDCSRDRTLSPRKYFTAAQLHAVKEEKTLYLQCQWRGYVARKRAWEMRNERLEAEEHAKRSAWERKQAEDAKQQVSGSLCARGFAKTIPFLPCFLRA